MEMVAHGVAYFSFNEFDTTLTNTAKEYLDIFGKYYRDSLLSKRLWIIDLMPGASDAERQRDVNLGLKRARIVVHYLETNYGIAGRNFRIRLHERSTSNCVGFIVKERHPKRAARRERRKLKREGGRFEEDAYFKDVL